MVLYHFLDSFSVPAACCPIEPRVFAEDATRRASRRLAPLPLPFVELGLQCMHHVQRWIHLFFLIFGSTFGGTNMSVRPVFHDN